MLTCVSGTGSTRTTAQDDLHLKVAKAVGMGMATAPLNPEYNPFEDVWTTWAVVWTTQREILAELQERKVTK